MLDRFREACGVFGILGSTEAPNLTYLGLYALQHRGQESAGIVASDGETLHLEKAMGLVADVFSETRLKRLKGSLAIGHVRYSTTGSSQLKNAQPILATCRHGTVALAHNGNLINAQDLRSGLEADGSIFNSSTDSEVIVHLIARSKSDDLVEATADALSQVSGAYSLVIMSEHELLGIRDPHGFRPLSLGRLGDAWVLASESCAFDLIDATFVRDLEPGEFLHITRTACGPFSRCLRPTRRNACSSTSIFPARTASSSERAWPVCARRSAGNWPRRRRSRRTW